MMCKGAIDKRQIFIIPTFGLITKIRYYGDTCIAIAFAWICFRFKVEWVKKARTDNDA